MKTVKERGNTAIKSRRRSEIISCYLMLSTQIVGVLVFTLIPMLWAAQKAFFHYTGAPSETRFVGLENFARLLSEDKVYWGTWLTTLKFAFFKLPIELPLALFLAVLLEKKIKGKGIFRAIYYLPNIISVAIVGLIFSNMFDYFGLINAWLVKLKLITEEISWFSSTGRAMTVLVTASVWSTFGINVLYFIAALSNVPKDVYEAAKIDGASSFVTFFRITLPMIAPVMQTILLLSINGTLHVNEEILVTTGGAPSGTTFSVMAYQVSKFVPGFAGDNVNIGYGCAMAIITSVIMCAVAIAYSKISSKLQNIY
ncbi:MAG: sugar ABC transporter permease [Clostridiales bacterium]|nr:sugar ABC transporter permease [Clostridiales bacterium]